MQKAVVETLAEGKGWKRISSQTFFNAKPKPSNLNDKSKNVSLAQNKTIKNNEAATRGGKLFKF